MNNNAIQRKLLLETDLTLDKAVTIAISISQTNEGAKALESGKVRSMSNKFKQDKAFQKSKNIISSESLIIHSDPTKNLTLTCNASPDGIDEVLSHGELPIPFASRSLNQAEKNYSQLDREGLSIIFGDLENSINLCMEERSPSLQITNLY